MKSSKKALYITLGAIDISLTIFLFIVSIIMLATMPSSSAGPFAAGFIGYFQQHPTIFLIAVVIPLFALLAINIIVLVMYMKKTNKPKKVEVNDLSEAQKEALRKELLKELAGDSDKKEE